MPAFVEDVFKFGEKVLDKLTFPVDDGVWVVYPSAGYGKRSGFEAGVMPVYSWRENGFENRKVNTLALLMQGSVKGDFRFMNDIEYFHKDKWRVDSRIDWFKGYDIYRKLNSNNSVDDKTRYSLKRRGASAEFLTRLSFSSGVHIGGELYAYHYDLDISDITTNVKGLYGGFVSGIGPVFMYDSRNHNLAPSSGFFLRGGVLVYDNLWFSDFDFVEYYFDIRQFNSVLGNSVLGFQYIYNYTSNDAPFFKLPELGGKDRMRGIGYSRWIVDKHIQMVRGELRFPVWWRFGGVFFTETGFAGDSFSAIYDDLMLTCGLGLRFRIHPREPLNIRFDAGFTSDGQSGFFVTLREAF
ncbi:BamA/TamA family outer membrane protein [Marinilabiliaceae bacterium ANBcel2]|nr:BamA/TamA family outer membrane protein [Marinilabiliaceae bacterium ANBcel2]